MGPAEVNSPESCSSSCRERQLVSPCSSEGMGELHILLLPCSVDRVDGVPERLEGRLCMLSSASYFSTSTLYGLSDCTKNSKSRVLNFCPSFNFYHFNTKTVLCVSEAMDCTSVSRSVSSSMMLSSSMIELDMSSSMMDGVAVLMPPPPPLLMQRKHICCPCLKIQNIVCKIILNTYGQNSIFF